MTPTSAARRSLVMLAAAAALVVGTGCSVPQIVRPTTPAVVDASLEKMEGARTRQRMRDIVASPEIKTLEKELLTGVVDGSLAAMTEQRRAERMGEIAARFSGVRVRRHDRAPRPGHAEGASGEPGPRDRQRDGHPDDRRALGGVAHTMGKEMLLGANEALTTIQQAQRSKATPPSLLGSVSLMAEQVPGTFKTAAVVVGLVIVELAVWVARLLTERRRHRATADERAAIASAGRASRRAAPPLRRAPAPPSPPVAGNTPRALRWLSSAGTTAAYRRLHTPRAVPLFAAWSRCGNRCTMGAWTRQT